MKPIRILTFILLTFPVFSFTYLLRLPSLNNVIVSIILIGLFAILSKKVRFDETWIYSWLIGLGLLSSLLYQLISSNNFSYANLVFPLTWLFFPFFMSYWLSIGINKLQKFCNWFFFLNFSYAFSQIFLVRLLGYSLVIHRYPSTDYVIPAFAQDTPFSYLGLTSVHQLISSAIGAAPTGLVTERVNLMIICVLCLLRWRTFNHKESSNFASIIKQRSTYTIIEKFNFFSAIVLLTISGSSLSIVLLLIPLLILSIRLSFFFKLKFKSNNFSMTLRSLRKVLIGLALVSLLLTLFLPILINLILLFDASGRIAAIVRLGGSLVSFSQNLDLFLFGSGVITTSSYDISTFLEGKSLLPRSLDVVGYTFNSFGVFGLIPFITFYPLILLNKTLLRKEVVAFFCLLAFVSAGSPINYIYIYAILLSLPRQHNGLIRA